MKNICELALMQMPPEDIDHHGSDLYLRVTPESKKLVEEYDYRSTVGMFIDNIDHVPWYDVPFAWIGEDSNLNDAGRDLCARLFSMGEAIWRKKH